MSFGAVKRVLILLTILLHCAAPATPHDSAEMTGNEIIARHLAAVGSLEALAKFRTRVAIGTVRKGDEPDSRMAIMSEAPNRFAAVYVFRNFDWRLIYEEA